MSTARTVYFSLYHQEIRLLEIAPAAWDEEIRCKLVHALLPSKPTFSALSYVWGSAKKVKSVILDGIEHPITANAYDALRRIRQTFGAVAVWIDAICINQSDKAERNHQVQLMQQIFSAAERVVVFLGEVQEPHFQRTAKKTTLPSHPIHFPGVGSTDRLSEFANRCSSFSMPTNYRFDGAIEVFCLIRSMAEATKLEDVAPFNPGLKAFNLSEYQRRLFEAVRQMMRCKWWNRMWTLQEIVVAKSVTVLYGCCVTSWETFAQSMKTFRSAPSGLIMLVEYLGVMKRYALAVHNLTAMRTQWASGGRGTLLSLLTHFSHREASDARDRVYALLGLAQMPIPITPDYSVDVLHTYQTTMLGIVEACGDLTVLDGDIGRKARRDIPSWVPDWTAESQDLIRGRTERIFLYATSSQTSVYVSNGVSDSVSTQRYLHHLHHRTAPQNQQSFLDLTSASQYTEVLGTTDWTAFLQCNFAEKINPQQVVHYLKAVKNYLIARGQASCLCFLGNGTISLPGAELTVVTAVGQPNPFDRRPESAIRSWATMIAKLKPNANTWELFFRTICADVVYDSKVEGFERRVRLDDLPEIAYWVLYDPHGPFGEGQYKDSLIASIWTMITESLPETFSKSQRTTTLDIYYSVRIATYRRAFFLTKDNSFGLGPIDTAIGDKIYMLLGARTPFVLRETGFKEVLRRAGLPPLESLQWGCFKIVGDCFASGYMDGEGMSSWYENASAKMKKEVSFDFGRAISLCKHISDLWDKCRTSREELTQALDAINSQHPWRAIREFAEDFLSRREFFAEYMPKEDENGVQDSKIEVTLGDSPWMIQTDDLQEVASSTSESLPSREYLSEKRRIFNQRLAWIHDTEQQALKDIVQTFKAVDETVVRNQVDVHLV